MLFLLTMAPQLLHLSLPIGTSSSVAGSLGPGSPGAGSLGAGSPGAGSSGPGSPGAGSPCAVSTRAGSPVVGSPNTVTSSLVFTASTATFLYFHGPLAGAMNSSGKSL